MPVSKPSAVVGFTTEKVCKSLHSHRCLWENCSITHLEPCTVCLELGNRPTSYVHHFSCPDMRLCGSPRGTAIFRPHSCPFPTPGATKASSQSLEYQLCSRPPSCFMWYSHSSLSHWAHFHLFLLLTALLFYVRFYNLLPPLNNIVLIRAEDTYLHFLRNSYWCNDKTWQKNIQVSYFYLNRD